MGFTKDRTEAYMLNNLWSSASATASSEDKKMPLLRSSLGGDGIVLPIWLVSALPLRGALYHYKLAECNNMNRIEQITLHL